MLEDFFHPNPNINRIAFFHMARDWKYESIEMMINFLNHKDISLRRKSVAALSSFGLVSLKPVIKEYKITNDRNIRTSCVKVLVKLASANQFKEIPEDLLEVIHHSLMEDIPELSLTVISLLRQLDEAGLHILIDVIKNHRDILIVKAAITAIGEFDNPLSIQCLKEILKDKNKDVLILDSARIALDTLKCNNVEPDYF